MSDLFGAAAARAQQKRNALADNIEITMKNNALVSLIAERAAEKAAEAQREKAWQGEIKTAFDGVIKLANSLGRGVKEITFNGEVAFVVRDCEAVRVYIGKIRDLRALQIAVAQLMNGAMGC